MKILLTDENATWVNHTAEQLGKAPYDIVNDAIEFVQMNAKQIEQSVRLAFERMANQDAIMKEVLND